MLVVAFYQYPCQTVMGFVFVELGGGGQGLEAGTDKFCPNLRVFGSDLGHP